MTATKTTTRNHNNLHITTRNEFHKNFGGIIYQSDFNIDFRGKSNTNGSIIAARIESDNRHFAKLRNVLLVDRAGDLQ